MAHVGKNILIHGPGPVINDKNCDVVIQGGEAQHVANIVADENIYVRGVKSLVLSGRLRAQYIICEDKDCQLTTQPSDIYCKEMRGFMGYTNFNTNYFSKLN